MKKKLIMYVYGDITTDARVNRAANALADDYDIILISTNFGKKVNDGKFKNILVGDNNTGMYSLFMNLYCAYKIIREEHPDIVYCHDYYSSILAYFLMSKKYCMKIIYDAHELIIPEPNIKDRRLSFFYWFEKKIINKVDLAICASYDRCQFMVDHYKMKIKPLVIRNISQLEINHDDVTNNHINSLNDFFAKPGPTVVYAGVVTKTRRISELAKAVSELAPKFKLLIVGKGDALEELKKIASQNKNLVCAFTGAVPYICLGAILNKCDIGFVYYPLNTLNNAYCASNKVYEYASVLLPMISNENPTIKVELEKNMIGIASNDFKSALDSLSIKLKEYRNACQIYNQANPWESDAKKLLSAVNTLAFFCLL